MNNRLWIGLLVILATACRPGAERNPFDAKTVFSKTLNAAEQAGLDDQLGQLGVDVDQLQILLRGFKSEERLELWVKNASDPSYQFFKAYAFCTSSGTLGPKRQEGDLQIPEGVYHIDRFNPNSSYFLSLGLNYPNSSDKIRGHATQPGSDIFIHGKCVTVGCIPITDEWIRELYFLAETAKTNGQSKIPVLLFPFEMTTNKLRKYQSLHPKHSAFWAELLPVYAYFETHQHLPDWSVTSTGAYEIRSTGG
ncbi:MAG: L,D-transpeptidase family protein [Bacteroidota bacterium]